MSRAGNNTWKSILKELDTFIIIIIQNEKYFAQ